MVSIDSVPAIARSIFDGSYSYLRTSIGDDDCALLDTDAGCLVITTDLMNHRPALVTLNLPDQHYNYGYLMASANLSDLYGTGAKPLAILVGLLVPDDLAEQQIRQVLSGIEDCCKAHSVPVIGGDTKRSDRLQGYAVAIGTVNEADCAFTRTKARAGQCLLVSGPLGDFNAATFLLANEMCPPEWLEEARSAITRPTLRRKLSLALSRDKLAQGGLDISDGLGMDLWRLAEASNVGLNVVADLVPIGPLAQKASERFGFSPLAFVFATGGDWQFAFTCARDDLTRCTSLGAIHIGEITESGGTCHLDLGTGRTSLLPRFGHSDDRGLDFGAEINLGVKKFSSEA